MKAWSQADPAAARLRSRRSYRHVHHGNGAGRHADIGQSIVTIMLENAGFVVHNLGTDVHPDRFIATALEHKADLVGFSALLSTTVYYQKVTIEEFQKAGHRDKVKILIGGAPTSQEWADDCGADGWGPRRGGGGEARVAPRQEPRARMGVTTPETR
jgi:methanogenic corrinoid protein MtbC1